MSNERCCLRYLCIHKYDDIQSTSSKHTALLYGVKQGVCMDMRILCLYMYVCICFLLPLFC